MSAHAQFRVKVHAEIASGRCRRDVVAADRDAVDRKLVLPAWRGEPEELGLVGIELLAVRLHPGGDVIEAFVKTTNELLRNSSPARAVDLRVVGVQMLCNYYYNYSLTTYKVK